MLPDDLVRYRLRGKPGLIDPDEFKIARAARMSMSIPYVFEPVELEHKDRGPSAIIDGGTISNFPVWLFDDRAKVRLPGPVVRPEVWRSTFNRLRQRSELAAAGVDVEKPEAVP